MSEIHSDWGDWLPRAVADAEPDPLAVWYLGCNGFAVKARDGTTAFVDPYLNLGRPPRTTRMIPVPFDPGDVRAADAVFATHEHTDHVDGPSQAPILAGTGATFYGPEASVAETREQGWTDEWAVDDDQFAVVDVGDTVELGALTVHVEPAHDPDAAEPVAYVFECEDATFYHAGDGRPADELAETAARFDVNVGAVAFGSAGLIPDKETGEPRRREWYNDENEVVEVARALELDRLLPTHWDMWRGLTADPKVLHEHVTSYEYPERLEVVKIGDRVDV
ncbi:MAG: MBL fold metallo-hydrolase [Halobacteriaceae archaeon]